MMQYDFDQKNIPKEIDLIDNLEFQDSMIEIQS